MAEIVNKVAKSGIITIDFERFYPQNPRKKLDFSIFLFQGIVLREKEFRDKLQNFDFSIYNNAYVHVEVPEEAIIQSWAFMLLSAKLQSIAAYIYIGTAQAMENAIAEHSIDQYLLENELLDARVVIKGCSKVNVPPHAYAYISLKLKPLVKMLMFGEPCSTVPVYKKSNY